MEELQRALEAGTPSRMHHKLYDKMAGCCSILNNHQKVRANQSSGHLPCPEAANQSILTPCTRGSSTTKNLFVVMATTVVVETDRLSAVANRQASHTLVVLTMEGKLQLGICRMHALLGVFLLWLGIFQIFHTIVAV